MKISLNLEIKLLLIILDDYFQYLAICRENKTIWDNYEQEIWEKLLKINGFNGKLPKLSEIIKISEKAKKHRDKNIKVYTPLPSHSPILTKLYRNTAWARYEKQKQLESISKRFKEKKIHRFYPSLSKRYRNLKHKRVA